MAPEKLSYPIPTIGADEYFYDLPGERIASHPLPERDHSRLLVAHCATGEIQHKTFSDIVHVIPAHSLVVMNNTRVITARIFMQKPTGGKVEVFCLHPLEPAPDPAVVLAAPSPCRWQCMIGGRNIKPGDILLKEMEIQHQSTLLTARILERKGMEAVVEFSWTSHLLPFSSILEHVGVIPLPPYIKRDVEPEDIHRYQTVYAHYKGSVAAPTAGLHFTEGIVQSLQENNVSIGHVTLHVGAGTFQPIQTNSILEHQMHYERITVSLTFLEQLIGQVQQRERDMHYQIIPVGTTSVRTLESLYWFGVRLVVNDGNVWEQEELIIEQWDPYRLRHSYPSLPSASEALQAIRSWLAHHQSDELTGLTQLMIIPGYDFVLCDALVTNFHQPGSTLILLVAAFLGKELWRKVYNEALSHDYRFLSFGDSSLLLRNET